MKKIIRLVGTAVLLSLLVSGVSSCRKAARAQAVAKSDTDGISRFLVVGIDDAAENTDVMLLCAFDSSAGKLNFVQIPRDTYFEFGKCQNKINQLFAADRLAGKSRKEALAHLSKTIEDLFCLTLDASFGIDSSGFYEIVEAIGGVDVTLEREATFSLRDEEITLPAGENHLNGHIAEAFVRSRKGYTGGDLARLDVQKVFLSALFSKVQSGLSIGQIFSAIRILTQNAVSDANFQTLCSLYLKNRETIANADPSFVTLPGKAALSESGLSYYIVSKRSAESVAVRYLYTEGAFDPEERLAGGTDPSFRALYDGS